MKLQINKINKHFPSQHGPIHALSDINVNVNHGEFLCLVGPSGCGKSTLLNIIAGLELPTEGEFNAPEKLGFMFQESALFPWLSVKDNIAFGLKIKNLPRTEVDERVNHFLNMVHLQNFAKAYPHELSGGMKQRVALARMLITEPEILLMDEPFAALDAQTREIMYHELQEIWFATKKTIILVTHNVREAVCLGDRVLVMTARPGKIKKEFNIDLPRPRTFSDLNMMAISNEIMNHLKEEIDAVVERSRRV